MMFLVIDNATNNVLAEFDSRDEANQCRAEFVSLNDQLAQQIEVVDFDSEET